MKQKRAINIPPQTAQVIGAATGAADMRRLKMWLGIGIAVFAFLLYARSISFSYTYDDISVVTKNALTQQGIKGIPEILKTDYWYGFQNELRVPQYRPSSLVVLALEWQFFPNNPHIGHLVNVLFYALTCWLLFLLLCKLVEGQSLLFPLVCALLYTAHPIHTEVACNIKSLDEIFCFFFGLLSVFLVVKTIEKKSVALSVASALSFFIALASKETAVSFLIIMPLVLFVFTKAYARRILMNTLVYAAVAAVFFFIWYSVCKQIPKTVVLLDSPLTNTLLAAHDFVTQKATAFYILFRYIILLIFPLHQSYDYSLAQIPLQHLSDSGALLGVLLYFSIGIYGFLKIKGKSKKAFAILFFLFTLAPVSNIFILIGSTMAERFLYMPSLGFCMLLALFLVSLFKKNKKAAPAKAPATSGGQFISTNSKVLLIAFLLTGVYSVKTIARSAAWKNDVALFGTDVKVADKSARAHFNWGSALINDLYPAESDAVKKNDMLDEAIRELSSAISIFAGHPDSYKNLAYCYDQKKDYADEIKTYNALIRLYNVPDTDLFYSMALACSRNNEYDKAVSFTDSMIKYNSDSRRLHSLRGFCFDNKGMNTEAIREYEIAIKMDPANAEQYFNLGASYLSKGENDKAAGNFEKAIALNPGDVKSFCYLGRSQYYMKQYQPAIASFNKALAVDSTDEETMKFISMTYITLGDTAKAMSYFRAAKRMKAESKRQ